MKKNIYKLLQEVDTEFQITEQKKPTKAQEMRIMQGDLYMQYLVWDKDMTHRKLMNMKPTKGTEFAIQHEFVKEAITWHKKLGEPLPELHKTFAPTRQQVETTDAPMTATASQLIDKRKRVEQQRDLERQAHSQWSQPRSFLGHDSQESTREG